VLINSRVVVFPRDTIVPLEGLKSPAIIVADVNILVFDFDYNGDFTIQFNMDACTTGDLSPQEFLDKTKYDDMRWRTIKSFDIIDTAEVKVSDFYWHQIRTSAPIIRVSVDLLDGSQNGKISCYLHGKTGKGVVES
jgi:hypothetical protein